MRQDGEVSRRYSVRRPFRSTQSKGTESGRCLGLYSGLWAAWKVHWAIWGLPPPFENLLRCNLHALNSTHCKCASQWLLSKLIELCNHHPNLVLEHLFSFPQIRFCLQAQATTDLHSVPIDLPFLVITYKWNHTHIIWYCVYNKKYKFGLRPRFWHRAPKCLSLGIS